MKYKTKQFQFDVFEIHCSSDGKISNLKSLKKWLKNDSYFKYDVYTNSEGIIVLKVRDYMDNTAKFELMGDGDVLMFPIDKNGKRYDDVYYPVFVKHYEFSCRFE